MTNINVRTSVLLLVATALFVLVMPGLADEASAGSRGNNYIIAIGVNTFPQSQGFLADLTGCVQDAVAFVHATQASGLIPEVKPEGKDLDRARKARSDADRRQCFRTLMARSHYLLLADDPSGLPATRANILAAVQAARDLTSTEANSAKDVVMVEVASHGCELPESGIFLCPQDTRITSLNTRTDDIKNSTLSAHEFVTDLSKLPVKLVLSSFDICRDDPRAVTIRGAGDDVAAPVLTETMTRGMTPRLIPEGAKNIFSLFACSAGQSSREIPGRNRGCFSYFLTKGLLGEAADENGHITVGDLTTYVHKAVAAYTDYQQVPTGRLPSDRDIASVEDIPLVIALRLKQIYRPGTVSHYQCDLSVKGSDSDKDTSVSADVTETVLPSNDDGSRVRFEMGNFDGTEKSMPSDFRLAPVTCSVDLSANTLTTDAGPDQEPPSGFELYGLMSDLFDIRYFSFPDENMTPNKTWAWDHPVEMHKQSNNHMLADPDDDLHGRATFIGLKQKVKHASSGQAWEVEVVSDSTRSHSTSFDFTCLFDTADCQLVSMNGDFVSQSTSGQSVTAHLSVLRTEVEAPENGEHSGNHKPRLPGPDWGKIFQAIISGLAQQSGK